MRSLGAARNSLPLWVSLLAAARGLSLGSRIFGGDEATDNEFPTQVFILSLIWVEERTTFEFLFCGGTILTEKWILTAAHCVNATTHTIVRAGSSDRTLGDEYSVLRTIPHYGYSFDPKHGRKINDIALVELEEALILDGFSMAAAKLPARGRALYSGRGIVIGWGRHTYDSAQEYLPGTLQKLDVDIIVCPDETRNAICARSDLIGSGICSGDQGSPLLLDDEVHGVASYMEHSNKSLAPEDFCDDVGSWGVFTPVKNHRLWIRKHTGL